MSYTLPELVATTFSSGLFYGLYLVTVGYANRWLLFADEGWKIRKTINWSMVIITNLISAMTMANAAVAVQGPMAEADFVGRGHLPTDYIRPPWEAIVKVSQMLRRKLSSNDHNYLRSSVHWQIQLPC
jgi:hypothetical protein